jgi:hypothetical protein
MSKSLKNSLHAHGCVRCATRYQDACTEYGTDALCTACRGGKPWQLLIDSNAPHACCVEHSRLVTKIEKASYRLAGSRLWFICKKCSRTHPFDPRTQTRTP